MRVQVILNMEVGTEEAAYADVKDVINGPRCYSFEIKNEEQITRERMCKDELLEHVYQSCHSKEEFQDVLEAIGFTHEEPIAIAIEHADGE